MSTSLSEMRLIKKRALDDYKRPPLNLLKAESQLVAVAEVSDWDEKPLLEGGEEFSPYTSDDGGLNYFSASSFKNAVVQVSFKDFKGNVYRVGQQFNLDKPRK